MKKRFTMHYADGAKVDVIAKDCTVTKRGAVIIEVVFDKPKRWLSFYVDGLMAVTQRRRFL